MATGSGSRWLRRAAFGGALLWLAAPSGLAAPLPARPVHHYVFVGADREQIHDPAFLATPALEGAQVRYSWRQLEPAEGEYDFSAVREDLAFLESKGKRLFLQLQDVSYSADRVNVPRYLLRDTYRGGADKQYEALEGGPARHVGWAARRWDPAVQARLHALFAALGQELDGRIEGINLAETSLSFGEEGTPVPKDFTFEGYRDAVVANLRALRRAFPKSVALQYANFMPGEWRPTDDHGYLRAVYEAAKASGVGVGGPDLLPHRRGHQLGPYPLIREVAGAVPIGIAVQEGNYADPDPKTGQPSSVTELLRFAAEDLKVDYLFWCSEEPFFSRDVIPLLRGRGLAPAPR